MVIVIVYVSQFALVKEVLLLYILWSYILVIVVSSCNVLSFIYF